MDKMKVFFKKSFLLILLSLVFSSSVFAQAPKLVVGYIYNKEELEKNRKNNVPLDPSEVTVFVFNTVDEAREVYEKFKNKEFQNEFLNINTVAPDFEGYYEVIVPDNGALVIRYGLGEPALEPINGRSRIVTYLEGGITLEGVSIIGNYTEITSTPSVPEQYGNVVYVKNANVLLPKHIGKSNARMLVTPYVYNHSTGDTAHYRAPRLYSGSEFRKAHQRYTGFDLSRDTLNRYTYDNVLNSRKHIYYWNDTVILPNSKDNFQVLADVYLQDYRGIYRKMDLVLSSRYTRKPLKFLNYSFMPLELDPYQYEEKAKKVLIEGSEDVSFNFSIGKAELDMDDPVNVSEYGRLKSTLNGLVTNVSSKLKELHVTSVSSPDGPYRLNESLSYRRLKYAENLIKGMLPADKMKQVYTYTKDPSRVATWSEFLDILKEEYAVADTASLLADSLAGAIEGIEKVIADYPGNHDAQSLRISRLKLYKPFIVKYLPKLRSMKCEYVAEEFRELKPDEILEKYLGDEDYRTGKKYMELYEYWNLFNIVKDEKELENLYRLAYDYSVKINPKKKPWVLAANNLAVSYIKRDTFDFSVLEPLIDRRVASVNQIRRIGGSVEYVNLEEVVANQLIMYVRNEDFANASIMAKILPNNEKYRDLIAFTYCLGGYYKVTGDLSAEEKQRRLGYFYTVMESGQFNRAVMLLAVNTAETDARAMETLNQLPADDAKVNYLKAVCLGRQGDARFNEAALFLKTAFILDKELVDVAKTDGDISEDLLETAIGMYEVEMHTLN